MGRSDNIDLKTSTNGDAFKKVLQKSTEKKRNKRLDRLDLFSAQVRGFNFQGRRKVYTQIGLLLSAALITSILCYSSNSAIKLYRGSADSIIHTTVPNQYPNSTKTLRLHEEVFQIAFGVVDQSKDNWKRNYHTPEDFLDDGRFVEWKV